MHLWLAFRLSGDPLFDNWRLRAPIVLFHATQQICTLTHPEVGAVRKQNVLNATTDSF